jgi:hypothetical protein
MVQLPKPLLSKTAASNVLGTLAPPAPPVVADQFAILFQLEDVEAIQNLLAAVATVETHNKKETHTIRKSGLINIGFCSYLF